MSKHVLKNPFRYGKPVSPKHFVGRDRALHTVFDRLNNCESTAVVGLPHIGKSSFLRFISDQQVHTKWLDDDVAYRLFIDIDCHMFPANYDPSAFWRTVLDHIEAAFTDETIRRQIGVSRQSGYGSFTLKQFLDLLATQGIRVILLIDEFDILLHHPNFNTAEFFGALRALSSHTESLALITASRMSIAEMNRRSQEINPLGSPFFNNMVDVRLQPLLAVEVKQLLDRALDGKAIIFTPDDYTYIMRSTGGNPFLVQMAAAALFDAILHQKPEVERRKEVTHILQRQANAHFEDLWQYMGAGARRAAILLSLAEHPQQFVDAARERLEDYGPELYWLRDTSLIESVDDSLPQQYAQWDGGYWRISVASFVRWIIDYRKWQEFIPQPIHEPQERNRQVIALSPKHREYLEQQRDGLQKELELRFKKVGRARRARAIETNVARHFELEQLIQDEEAEISQLQERIDTIERQLG
jgi:hypothetical protein